jgi:hypothetical protein
MTSEFSVEAVAKNFLRGNYGLDMEAMTGPEPADARENPPPANST